MLSAILSPRRLMTGYLIVSHNDDSGRFIAAVFAILAGIAGYAFFLGKNRTNSRSGKRSRKLGSGLEQFIV